MRWNVGWMAGLALVYFCSSAWSQGTPESRMDAARKLVDSLHFRSGEIKIGGDLATLKLPDSLRYLDPKDTRTVLVDLWGNPPDGQEALGMIVPAGVDLLSGDSWAVEISYDEDGHVKDDDAEKINYDELLARMKQSVSEGNAERQKQGYEPIQLIGWAAPPKYDRNKRKLYWAKELEFGGSPEHTLNYNLRILGRRGVLVLNAIAARKNLPAVEAATPALLSAVSFNPGHRYADFDSSTDKIATYGIAALVAGGVAAKLGFFKLLWVGILAFKKLIVVGVVGAIAFVRRMLGKRAG